MTEPRPRTPTRRPLTRARITEICGDITDAQASALIRADVTEAELKTAALWATGDTELLAREGRSLTGGAAVAYDILSTTEEFEEQPD